MPAKPLAEIAVRGTLMYLALFILMRLLPKRQAGGLTIADVLLVVLLADAAQNGMAGEYRSVTEGAVLVGTIAFWSVAIDWLAFRSPALRRILEPRPLPLIENGRVLRRNMHQELVTMEELMSRLRQEGIESPADVERAFMEPDGNLSVVKRETR